MSLSKAEAEILFNLGFKRQSFEEKVYPTDIYEFKGSVWCIGGRIVPNSSLSAETCIYNEGVWLPTLEDFIYWLDNNECKFSVIYNGNGYKVEITDNQDNAYKAKGGTMEFALYKGIMEILKKYGGNPVQKPCEIIEAELISED
ncbi:hypothetical protein LY28_03799 [Ruminiclostridium sufflavum DSM 19573]|uniref:Uncharacterized protein n=1 Tax=Ruminiclostridium sufflavum DSM 19573 TaxID=1121337 RepID=A0A318XRJ7_9FIRM|nr:hypothetical protein [Ruminiclostridium sufflavum]PYG83879.1 hypothetical protein LY28_03799 [Ruminiclostridium sufflavum DSM 19573]